MRRLLSFLTPIGLLLVACTATPTPDLEATVQAIIAATQAVLPVETPSLAPTSASTPKYTPSATPEPSDTATPVPTTAKPMATPEPSDTATPVPTTAKPTATPEPAVEKIEVEGTVVEVLSGMLFRVELDDGQIVEAYLSGKMRQAHIRVLLGDRVQVELTPYDPEHGRIVYRYKKAP